MEFARLNSGLVVPEHVARREVYDGATAQKLKPIRGAAGEMLWIVYNSATSLTVMPVKQPTGNVIQTMMCITPNANCNLKVVEWGVSFDGASSVTPGEWTLVDTTSIFPTMTTAYASADIQQFSLSAIAQNGATTAGFPLQIGTALSGFATTTVTEGTTTVSRVGDIQLLPPTAPYIKQFPLGREFEQGAGKCLRIRCLTPATVNAYCYIVFSA